MFRELDGHWRMNFREALYEAYPIVQEMEMLVDDYFSQSFSSLAPKGLNDTYEDQLFSFIRLAKRRNFLLDLVAAAYERRPYNRKLKAIADDLNLTLSGRGIDNPLGRSLEALIEDNARFLNPQLFVERLPELQDQVCWVSIPGGGGTGFLVGPDLVLTNEHVITTIRQNPASASQASCVFDFYNIPDESRLMRKEVTRAKLQRDDWLVDWLPAADSDSDPLRDAAGEDELDYGLLRLELPIGDMPVGGPTIDHQARETKRGWIDTTADAPPMRTGEQIFLLQHPQGEPLRMAVGTVSSFDTEHRRLRYDANSKSGSSGSPCFNADLQLVALHHARDAADPPRWNQAIPLDKIRTAWSRRSVDVP